MKILAFDPGTANPAVALCLNGRITYEKIHIERGLLHEERLARIAGAVMEWAGSVGAGNTADLLVIEGYSHGMKYGLAALAEVVGGVKIRAWEKGIPMLVVNPSQLKLFATGSGKAIKSKMAVAAFKEGGREFEDEDCCDAYWLARVGHAALCGAEKEPKYRQDVLKKILAVKKARKRGKL